MEPREAEMCIFPAEPATQPPPNEAILEVPIAEEEKQALESPETYRYSTQTTIHWQHTHKVDLFQQQ